MIGEIDQEGNGYITFEAFIPVVNKVVREDAYIKEEITEAFRVFDQDNHGIIDVRSLPQVLNNLGDILSKGNKQSIK